MTARHFLASRMMPGPSEDGETSPTTSRSASGIRYQGGGLEQVTEKGIYFPEIRICKSAFWFREAEREVVAEVSPDSEGLPIILEVRKCLPVIPIHCTGSVPHCTGPGEQCTGFVTHCSIPEHGGI